MNSFEDTGRTAANLASGGSEPSQNTAQAQPYPAPPEQRPPEPAAAGSIPDADERAGWQPPPAAPTAWQPTTGERPRRWKRAVAGVAAALVLTGGAAGAGGAWVYLLTARPAAASTPSVTQATGVAINTSLAGLIAKVKTEVVSVTVRGATVADQGSGIIVRSDGTILTNNHVISAAAGGGTITVTFSDGTSAPATVLAANAGKDLALIKAAGVANLSAATLGDSSAVRVGDTVVAIGNELGLPGSVSAGIISGLHRTLTVGVGPNRSLNASTTYSDAIQTDAATNPGDSGGALFNSAGQVIGVNTAIATASSGSSGSIGVGFAIPSNDAAAFINQTLNQSSPLR